MTSDHRLLPPNVNGRQLEQLMASHRRAGMNNMRSWLMTPRPYFSDLDAASRTAHATFPMPGSFDLVRLAYANDRTGPAYTVDKAVVAPSARFNDGYNPLTADAAPASWMPVTFNNNGADGLSPSPAGNATSVTVPVAPNAEQLGWAFSDWMRISSVDRADGGKHPLLMVRTLLGSTPARLAAGNLAEWKAGDGGDMAEYRSMLQFGDLTDGNFPSEFGIDAAFAPLAVQWYSRALGGTVMVVGDSIFGGSITPSMNAGFGHIACEALSKPGLPVVQWNSGWSGQNTEGTLRRAVKEIDFVRPEVVVIASYSTNDLPTNQTIADAGFSRALDLAYYAMSKGAIPIIATPLPCNQVAGPESCRRLIVDRVRRLGGFLTVDFEAVLGTGGTPNKLRPEYDSGDGTHPNRAGHAVMAAALLPVLSKAL